MTSVPDPMRAGATAVAERDATSIRPFTFEVTDEELSDLRQRVSATRWPDRETDPSQGVRLATIQALATYWATEYDWRAFERRFAALPHFVTEIDGVDVHFIHVRSKHDDALPLVVTHGWPGSTVEQLKIIGPLTDPTAHGASAEDAFHLVIPSLPGHGFSGKPTETGWDPIRIARAWVVLMGRLGYDRFVAQGGDWGNAVTEQLALLKPDGLLGIHTNMPATLSPEISMGVQSGAPVPAGLSADEQKAYEILVHFFKTGVGYAGEMGNRPQTLYAIEDSPVGLAAWMLDHDVAQLRADRTCLRGATRRADARRRPRQRDPLLAHEDGDFVGALVLGEPSRLLRRQRRRHPRRRDACSRTSSIRLRGAGRRRHIPSSSTTTGWARAVTSPPGSSRRLLSEEIRATFRSLR